MPEIESLLSDIMSMNPPEDATEQLVVIVRRLMKEREWLPIETAPMDATPVLVYMKHITGYQALYIAKWNYGEGSKRDYKEVYGSGCMYGIKPTHWMSLPALPEALKAGE